MLLPESDKGDVATKREFKGKRVRVGIWKRREVEFVSGEILIKLKPGKDRDTAFQEKLFSGNLKKAKLKRKFDRFGVGLIDAGDEIDVLKICELLEKDPEIEYAEPNMIDRDAATIPNDTGYPNQWALPMIDAPNAWDIETGNSNVLIAVLDTGIPMDGTPPSICHPDLNDPTRIILGHDYVNNDAYPRDDRGHGTHVTGIASAQTNNAIGVAGLCWGSKIYVIKTRDEYGSGSHQDFYDAVIEAVDYAVNNGFRLVINYSAGGGASNTKEQAVIYARDRDCLIVAAAGNDYEGAVGYPAAYSASYDNVIAVSATDSMDHFAAYSNKGPEINVAAPGSYIYSTMPNYPVTLNDPPPVGGSYNQDYDYLNGTSMATPYVSGLAALLLSCDNGLTAAEVRDIIESTSDDLGSPAWDEYYGYGRIDANAALRDACPVGACLREGLCFYKMEGQPCLYKKEFHDCAFACMAVKESLPACFRFDTGCLREGFFRQCLREGFIQTCMKEGVIQTCMSEGVIQGIPQRFFGDPRYLKSERHIGEFQRLKHIKPLTKRGPLSHKKRYYPGR
jgi:hypothetical protein